MTIQEFTEYLRNELEKMLQEGETIQVEEQMGNNEAKKVYLVLKKNGREDLGITNIENYYQSLLAGDTLEDIVADMAKIIQIQPGYKILKGNRSNWGSVCNQVIYRLIHYGKNIDELADKAYIQWQEFAIVFYIIEFENGEGYYSVPVTKKDLDTWKIDIETLYHAAARNTPELLTLQIDNLLDIVAASSIWQYDSEMMELVCQNMPAIYVLSNAMDTYGAAVILYEGILKDFSRKIGHDFYLVPLSVNEVLAVGSQHTDPDELRKLHRSFLAIRTDDERWLSDEVYLYRSEYDDVVWMPEHTVFS